MKNRNQFFVSPHVTFALLLGSVLAVIFSINAQAEKCKISGKINAPQNLKCDVYSGDEEKVLNLNCVHNELVGAKVYEVKVGGKEAELVNNTYTLEQQSGLVFESNSGRFKVDSAKLSAEYKVNGRTYKGQCERGSY